MSDIQKKWRWRISLAGSSLQRFNVARLCFSGRVNVPSGTVKWFIARQISQHRLGSTERSLCIDDPLGFACRRQICRERVALYQRGVIAEKLQAACLMGRDQLLQEQSAEQPREHAHGQEEAWPA